MANTDVELEQQLKEVGKKLLHQPDAVDELLPVLDQVEILTTKLIVSSFEDLADQSSRSYIRRASILETVSKVRSCVIMLDLECDEMIVEMFEHFLRSVRDYHREDVLKKSAEKLNPYLMSALTALCDLLDTYFEIVTKLADKSKQAKGSQDETQQADDSKITTASLDHVDQVDKEEPYTDDKLAKSESKPEPTPKTGEKKSDTNIDSAEPSDSSHVEGEKEAVKLESEDEKDNDVKESAISAPVQSETEKDNDDVPQQDEVDTENAASPSKSKTPLDESRSKKTGRSKNKDLDQEENTPSVDVKAPKVSSDSDVKPQKRAEKMVVVAKEVKSQATIDSSEDDEAASDLDEEPSLKISKKLEPVNSGLKSKQSGKKAFVTKEVKHPDTIDLSKDDEAASKKEVVTKEAELPDTIDSSEDDKAASDSDDEPPQKVSKKLEPVNSGSKSKQSVAFRQHTCFIRNLEGVDLLTRSRGDNLYTLSLGDMMASSPICLLHGLVRGLPKLKFEKDHLCSACAMGKSKKKSHKPKSEDTNQEKLYLLHMDLCGLMRVASINGKKYILVIVDDYSRFTWVKCLRSKDEAPYFIIKFLKMIQVRLKTPAQRIRTNNGTEFVNQSLREYYEKVGISYETSVVRSP
ncbi:retrovirus-related pol polyprotein from transposon TNT 1-94 [Tanacetum coccineum]